MKIAEALLLRADMQKKLHSLRARIETNVLVQEGESPSENPNVMLDEAFAIADALKSLMHRINATNLSVVTQRGRSITSAIAERDALALKHSILQNTLGAAREKPVRYGLKEIRWVNTINVEEQQNKLEQTAKEIRDVNTEIQSANWSLELVESA